MLTISTKLKRMLISFALLVLLALASLSAGSMLVKAEDEPITPVPVETPDPVETKEPNETGEKTVVGHVFLVRSDLDNDRAVEFDSRVPVAKARIIAHRVDRQERKAALTNADGAYELELGPGLWVIKVEPTDESDPGNWVYARDGQEVLFRNTDKAERQEVNFVVVPAKASVAGEIVLPNGDPPPFPVIVSLRNGEGVGAEFVTFPGNGEFKVHLPSGRYDMHIKPLSDDHAGPDLDPIHLRPNQALDLGKIKLVVRAALVSGTVFTADETNLTKDSGGVAGIPIIAWHRGRTDVARTKTDENGNYTLKLSAGAWHIQPAPGPEIPYIFLGEGAKVELEGSEHKTDVDFKVIPADGTIEGGLVGEDGKIIEDIDGWAVAIPLDDGPNIDPKRIDAHRLFRFGAPIMDGKFKLHVPAGKYAIHIELAPGTPYAVTERTEVEVGSGETVGVRIPVKPKTEAIVGALVDPRNDDNPVTDVRGKVGAWWGDEWTATHIDPETGLYKLDVAAGVWHVDYKIDPEKYVKIGGAKNIAVPENQTVRLPLPITEKDAGISGTVLDPDGNPLPGAVVIFDGMTDAVKNLWLHTRTDENGNYRFALPHGRYRVGAVAAEREWINPLEMIVNVAPDTVVEDVDLKFHLPNSKIVGRITLDDAPEGGDVLIFAYTERGGFNWTTAKIEMVDDQTAVGDYSLPVVGDARWTVGAIFESGEMYWTDADEARVPADETVVVNFNLNGPRVKPLPVVVVFDSSEPQRITLNDGTVIFIPAGAMPVDGEVTVRVDPIARLPHQRHARVLKYGYAIHATDADGRPIEESFNHNVLIQFPIDRGDVNVRPVAIKPAYFSTTTNHWTGPERFAVDLEEGVVKMAIDHFTDFALLESDDVETVFLPVITR